MSQDLDSKTDQRRLDNSQLRRRMIGGAVAIAVLIVASVVYIQVEHPSLWAGASNGMRRGSPEQGGAVSDDSTSNMCRQLVPVLADKCPSLGGYLDVERCRVTSDPALSSLDDRRREILGEGVFLNLGDPGPEWFVTKQGELLTNNGVAMSHCKLDNVVEHIAELLRRTAPDRGETPKTYEAAGPDGDWLHETCSKFEIEVGSKIEEELFRNEAENEDKALRRAAKKVNMSPKMATEVWGKVSMHCPEVLN